ncbi:MAG: dTMP kinase [Acidobacteriota bacterium]|nr:dTMP kinase [Acidobacteriota bacterium]
MGYRLKKGILIVFEGIDGTGKTTQAEILLDRLRKKDFETVYFQEPSMGKWGRKIKKKAVFANSITPEEELDLFQKDRRENVEKNLKPALEKRKIVILDRYYFSTIAYQGARGIDQGFIRSINEEFVVMPDLVFILDIDVKNGLQRIETRKKRDILFEQEEYLVKAREIFKSFKGENIIHIDGHKPIEEISNEIGAVVFKYLDSQLIGNGSIFPLP